MIEYILHKCSVPGWSKTFYSITEVVDELEKHICGLCFEGDEEFNIEPIPFPVSRDEQGLYDLLSTPCGCEYDYEIIDND